MRWRSLHILGLKLVFGLILLTIVNGCSTGITRSPVPEAEIDYAAPYGIRIEGDIVREWGDRLDRRSYDLLLKEFVDGYKEQFGDVIAAGKPIRRVALALSGGGPDGAYGAGLLKGWSEHGDRPEFTDVTGISTGAIIALFAYLGPDYDATLEEIYTTYETDQLVRTTILSGLTGGSALTDASGYRALIEKYIDEDVVSALADAYSTGRLLLIGTTNIDAARPVVWNIGAIASSGHPDARRLIHDIVQASSAIPAAFPPVLIPVEGREGQRYDELHVDGGASQQVTLFSPSFPSRAVDEALGTKIDRTLYVIINNKTQKPYDPIDPSMFNIAGRALSSLLSGSGSGDVYKIFAITQRDGIDLNVTMIPKEFDVEASEPFDPVYMRALYDLGYNTGQSGGAWSDFPPDYKPWP